MLAITKAATASAPGIIGGLTATAVSEVGGDGVDAIGLTIIVTLVSVGFGLLSQYSRIKGIAEPGRKRAFVMNAGAVWLLAFLVASYLHTGWVHSSMIGLGVGLAGSRALTVFESAILMMVSKVGGMFGKDEDKK